VQLQIINAETNLRLSRENAMQLRVLKAPRGVIYDRNGVALARNRPSYSVCVLPYKLPRKSADRRQVIANLLKIRDAYGQPVFDSTDLVARIHNASFRRFDATSIREDAPIELVSVVEEHARELPGIAVETETRREYPLGRSAFHVLGYMGEVPESQYDSLRQYGYQFGDQVGKSGIERQYQDQLRGRDGCEYVEVDAYGKRTGTVTSMPRTEPTPGLDAWLTIDADLQRVADSAFADSLRGSVVAIDPRTGEVLVMFSSPGLDPNIFALAASLRSKYWAAAATDPSLPLNNRATSGTYTPGSTFKLISATAGLSCGKLQENSTMPRACTGSYRIGSRVAKCWIYPRGHGRFTLMQAIQQSCNVYFFQVGLLVGDKTINSYAQMFGLGARTGVDLPQEKEGWLSGEDAYNIRFAKRGWKWTAGLVLDLAIGQAQVVTPIQLACMVGALGNATYRYTPFLLKEFRTRDGAVVKQHGVQVASPLALSQETVTTIRKALQSVVEPGGTGGRAAVPGIPVGGKTGSAENPQGDLTHALFVACAPVDNPVIAISVVVENAGHGGSIAAPIAGAVLRYYFQNKEEGKRLVAEYAAKMPAAAQKKAAPVAPPTDR